MLDKATPEQIKTVVDNIRRSYGDEGLDEFTDQQIYDAWAVYSTSDDYPNEPFKPWIS